MRQNNLEPVVKRSAESLAIEALRTHVLSGATKPGQRLTETDLAARLCVSRATIRTALHQLHIEGLVRQIPYTGWEVVQLTGQDAWELYTLRSSLEALAARLAAKQRGPQAQQSLRDALTKLEQACDSADRATISTADFGLHKTIIQLAQHGRLLKQYQLIEQQTRLYIHSSMVLVSEPAEVIDQHAPIVHAILAGRGTQAAKLSESHNLKDGELFVAYLNSKTATNRGVA